MIKISRYRLHLAGILLAFSSAAAALTPADGEPDLTLYIPGSQANDPVFGFPVGGTTVANAICAEDANNAGTGTTHIYFHTTGAASAAVNDNYSAVYCLASPAKLSALGFSLSTPGTYAGTPPVANARVKVWMSRRRLGASFVGLDAASRNQQLTFLEKPSSANCTAVNSGNAASSYSSGGTTYQWHFSCTTVVNKFPTGATSDVTPDAFHGATNVTPGSQPINPAVFDQRNVVAGHIIGVPLTLKLRNALQYAGIQSGLLPSTLTGFSTQCTDNTSTTCGCTVGNEFAQCQPSLSKSQLVSLLTGAIYDWGSVQVRVLANSNLSIRGTSTDLVSLVASGVAQGGTTFGENNLSNPNDTTVHICRRENGAGQQVAALANILQYPCLDGQPHILAETNGSPADVLYATSLGAVDNCLGDLNDDTNRYFSIPGTANERHNPAPYNDFRDIPQNRTTAGSRGNRWGMAFQTTERNASRSANYRFARIDGAVPTGEQVYLGHYPLVGEYGFSWVTANNATNYGVVKGGDINRLQSAIAKYGALGTTVAARNTSLSNHSWGQAGYIALSANGINPPPTWDPQNPVTPYVRSTQGGPNACAIPTANTDFITLEYR